jgi:hypothetical protein
MRIDLSDLDRLDGIAEALGRLFWCLMALAFLTAILGSAGTGFLVLVLGAAAFVGRAGIEDFVRARRERPEAGEDDRRRRSDAKPEPDFAVYRSARRRRPRSAV